MTALSDDLARNVAESFLNRLRKWVSECKLNYARLPAWLTAARVRVGWVNESIVCAFEDGPNGDSYEIRGPVGADTVVLLNVDDFSPKAASLKARTDGEGLIILTGTYEEHKRTVFNMLGESPAFFDCGYAGYHGPLALFNIVMQHTPGGADTSPVAVRFIPFALYVHIRDTDPRRLWSLCKQHLTEVLLAIHNSDTGTFYERLQSRASTFALNKISGVIVLGKDTGTELQELIQVRDYLRGKGYDAELIKDLPEIPMMSNEEKLRLWTLVSRFAVMVDRLPGGHLTEYPYLKEQRTILALLRQRGAGSTYMIGDDHMVDMNFIRLFEFDSTPLSVLGPVMAWAEEIAQKRTTAYNKAYPWRDQRAS
jgi:hypothetical protein